MFRIAKHTIILLTALLAIVALPVTVFASDISGATFSGVIQVTNNSSGVDYTNQQTVASINATNFIDGGYFNSGVTNAAILFGGSDIAFMPGFPDTVWAIEVPSINRNGLLNYILYNNATGGKIRYFPGVTGMSVPDNGTLELGGNFTVGISGFFDASNSGNLTNKTNAFTIRGDGSGNITAIIRNGVTQESYIINDDSAEDFFGVEWEAQTFTNNAAYIITAVKVRVFRILSPGDVTVSIRATAAGEPTGADLTTGTFDGDTLTTNTSGEWITITLSPIALDNATQYAIVMRAVSGSGANTVSWRADGSSPTYSGGTRVSSGNSGSNWNVVSGTDLLFETISDLEVTASGVTTGEHTITATANTSHFWISIDGVNTDNTTLSGANVTDNSENWVIAENAVMPYMSSANITVDGTLAGSWVWQYAATFSDLSANSNTATPTFRSATSNANVTASLLSWLPISQAIAPPFAVSDPDPWVSGNITVTGNFSTTVNATYPGADVVQDIATAGETPVQLPTILLSGVGIIALSLFTTHFLRKNRVTSLLAQTVVLSVMMFILEAMSIIDSWMVYLFLMIAIAVVMANSTRTFAGTGATGNNLVGFLMFSFIGMTWINRILEGRFLQSGDVDIINNVLVFQPFSFFGLFTIPVPNASFLINGIPALIRWDYGFFGGDAQILQYLLYSVTAVMSFILFVLALGAAYQMFSRGR